LAVYYDINQLDVKKAVITIGSFDGVHCGHRRLIRRTVELSRRLACRSAVVTFWPHPRQVIGKGSDSPPILNTLEEKIRLLAQAGTDDIIVFPFDNELSQTSALDFIQEVVVKKLNTCCLVVGKDHHFGKERSGNADNLASFVSNSGMRIEVVDLEMMEGKISSSAIRKALLAGDLQLANKMLGYEYLISGEVVHGNKLGRKIGFPTTNIEVPAYKLLPEEGVYRVKMSLDKPDADLLKAPDYPYLGMMYIGKRTILKQKDKTCHVEANIFDFDSRIYGKRITFALTHRIRGSIKFDSPGQLVEQLVRDKNNIIKIQS
jgi:riboflavin kinase/FMN adenylyltransferase